MQFANILTGGTQHSRENVGKDSWRLSQGSNLIPPENVWNVPVTPDF
jgi:hypothetical protein